MSLFFTFYFYSKATHCWNHATGADTGAEAHPPLIVRVLSLLHEVLVAHVVGSFVDHEAAIVHPDGVAAAEVGVKVRAVVAALVAATLEVFVLVEDDLESKNVTHSRDYRLS